MPHQHFQHFDPIRATGWKMQFLTCKDNAGKLHILILVNPVPNNIIFLTIQERKLLQTLKKRRKKADHEHLFAFSKNVFYLSNDKYYNLRCINK